MEAKEYKIIKREHHGLTNHPLFKVWDNILGRCYRPKDTAYHLYGSRGIKMCDLWRSSFCAFYDWCMGNGWAKGLEIDRFPDKNGNYEPSNCRFATPSSNCRNRRSNRLIEYNGQTKTLIEWSEETGISYHTLHGRLKSKWPSERLFEPKRIYTSL